MPRFRCKTTDGGLQAQQQRVVSRLTMWGGVDDTLSLGIKARPLQSLIQPTMTRQRVGVGSRRVTVEQEGDMGGEGGIAVCNQTDNRVKAIRSGLRDGDLVRISHPLLEHRILHLALCPIFGGHYTCTARNTSAGSTYRQ